MTVEEGCVRFAAEVQMNIRIMPACPCWRCGRGATKVGGKQGRGSVAEEGDNE